MKAKILIALLTLGVGVVVFALGVIVGAATVGYRQEELRQAMADPYRAQEPEGIVCSQRGDYIICAPRGMGESR
jgi:hypothetical protein